MKKPLLRMGAIGACFLLIGGCQKDAPTPTFEGPFLPANFPQPIYDLRQNPVTEAGFTLGKRLFYDPILSRDNTVACGDCHVSFAAFTHPDHPVSHGINDLLGRRNALPIQNTLWRKTFFWDGGVPHLDLAPLNAIQNPVEMDEDPGRILQKLRAHPQYPQLFKAAFGTEEINTARFLQAFSQFMAMLVSANSRYDRHVRNEPGGGLTPEELEGMALFRQKCASCHATDLFTDQSFRNNGLDDSFVFDKGRFEVSALPEDEGKFLVPSLRNITATAPYMHDGRFKTLKQVLDHYASGVKDSPTLDPLLRQADGRLGIPLTEEEKRKIIAFLGALRDEEFLRDKRFAE